MTTINILWIIALFFIQPVFIAGLLYTLWNRKKRLAYVRENYRLNFNPSFFEVSDYLLKTLLIGLLLSIVLAGVGVPLTIEWYLVYQVITVILFLISGTRFIHPVFTFSLASITLFILNWLGASVPSNWLQGLVQQEYVSFDFSVENISLLLFNSLVFIAMILLFSGYMMKKKEQNKFYPILRSSKRGKKVAKYKNNPLFLLPLVVIVPGNLISPLAAWWPLFSLGEKQYAFLLLPILIGFHFTISTQLLEKAIGNMRRDLQVLAVVSLFLAGISYFYVDLSVIALGLVFIGGIVVLYRHRRREKLWAFKYGPADEGLRVIAVRPKSPAERMGLSIGVIITHINEQEMNTKDDFYETLSYNRSYIRMRIKRNDGEVIMVETPLYDDDFNNLGLLIL